jgi:hypothetical protein
MPFLQRSMAFYLYFEHFFFWCVFKEITIVGIRPTHLFIYILLNKADNKLNV